jgi:hypothetical protein
MQNLRGGRLCRRFGPKGWPTISDSIEVGTFGKRVFTFATLIGQAHFRSGLLLRKAYKNYKEVRRIDVRERSAPHRLGGWEALPRATGMGDQKASIF